MNTHLKSLRSEYENFVRLENIQQVSKKKEKRERKVYTPSYTLEQANKKIQFILNTSPIQIEAKVYSFVTKVTLGKIISILNHIDSQSVLSIEVQRDKNVLPSTNLKVSQICADRLKAYFLEKTNLFFVSSIGYGAALVSQEDDVKEGFNCYVKMKLKKVK